MRFDAHHLPTYIPAQDGSVQELYRRIFEQAELLDRLGYGGLWVTEHHFHNSGGNVPDPAAFLAAVAARTRRLPLGVAISVLPLHYAIVQDHNHAPAAAAVLGDYDHETGRRTIIAGEPAECIETIQFWKETLGLTAVSGVFHFGGMPQELGLKNIRLFAERVMPAFGGREEVKEVRK